jgi:hypothetical protein
LAQISQICNTFLINRLPIGFGKNILVPENASIKHPTLLVVLQAGILYVLLLLAHGYVFGHQDLIEITGYLNYLQDPTLYNQDFYIQQITARVPNERWMFVQLLNFFNISTPWSFLVGHFVISIAMLSGLILTARKFIKSELFAFMAVFTTLAVFYKINLGGNEIYYNTLTSSQTAKAIGIWSIFFFLSKKPTTAILMLIPTSLIHPLVGIQLFLIFTGTLFVQQIKKGGWTNLLKKYWSIPVYLLTAGVWLYFLEKQFSSGDNLDSDAFFRIIEFRLAHHFIPSVFGLKNYVVLVPLCLFGWIYFLRKNALLFWLFNFTITGIIIYTIGVELLQNSLFLSTQWFKTTIWLKYFSIIAVFAFAHDLIKRYLPKAIKGINILILSSLVLITAFLVWKLPARHQTTFDMPWKGVYNDEIAIAKLASLKTPKDALFVTPVYFTHLKYYGKRSTYIDYKAMVHHKSVLPEWYQRVTNIYGMNERESSTERLSSKQMQLPSAAEGIKKLHTLGITHMITDKPIKTGTNLLGQKGKYYLYELD